MPRPGGVASTTPIVHCFRLYGGSCRSSSVCGCPLRSTTTIATRWRLRSSAPSLSRLTVKSFGASGPAQHV